MSGVAFRSPIYPTMPHMLKSSWVWSGQTHHCLDPLRPICLQDYSCSIVWALSFGGKWSGAVDTRKASADQSIFALSLLSLFCCLETTSSKQAIHWRCKEPSSSSPGKNTGACAVSLNLLAFCPIYLPFFRVRNRLYP